MPHVVPERPVTTYPPSGLGARTDQLRARSAPFVRQRRRPEQFEPVRLVFDLVGQARDRQQDLVRGRLFRGDDGRWRVRRNDRKCDQQCGEQDRNSAGHERQSSLAAEHPVPGLAVFATVGRAPAMCPALIRAYMRASDATAIARRTSVQRTSEDTVQGCRRLGRWLPCRHRRQFDAGNGRRRRPCIAFGPRTARRLGTVVDGIIRRASNARGGRRLPRADRLPALRTELGSRRKLCAAVVAQQSDPGAALLAKPGVDSIHVTACSAGRRLSPRSRYRHRRRRSPGTKLAQYRRTARDRQSGARRHSPTNSLPAARCLLRAR